MIQLRALWLLVFIAIGGMVTLARFFIYYGFYEPSWLSYPNPELPVLAESVMAGEVIPVEVTRVNRSGQLRVYTVGRELHCDSFEKPAVMEGSAPSSVESNGGLPTTVVSFVNRIQTQIPNPLGAGLIPMPSGTCWIEGATEINGSFRTIIVPWHTPKFRVISKADAAKQLPDPGGVP